MNLHVLSQQIFPCDVRSHAHHWFTSGPCSCRPQSYTCPHMMRAFLGGRHDIDSCCSYDEWGFLSRLKASQLSPRFQDPPPISHQTYHRSFTLLESHPLFPGDTALSVFSTWNCVTCMVSVNPRDSEIERMSSDQGAGISSNLWTLLQIFPKNKLS